MRASHLPIEFRGFVEGGDLTSGKVDVVVTDGFTGNVALKVLEGTVGLYTQFLREAFKSSLLAQAGYVLASRRSSCFGNGSTRAATTAPCSSA